MVIHGEEELGGPNPAVANPNEPNIPAIRERMEININGTGVVYALLFPTFSAFAGDFLEMALPSSLVAARYGGSRGILQERWGRTIVGGCLLVVLRDAASLFLLWTKQGRPKRTKVLDYGT